MGRVRGGAETEGDGWAEPGRGGGGERHGIRRVREAPEAGGAGRPVSVRHIVTRSGGGPGQVV